MSSHSSFCHRATRPTITIVDHSSPHRAVDPNLRWLQPFILIERWDGDDENSARPNPEGTLRISYYQLGSKSGIDLNEFVAPGRWGNIPGHFLVRQLYTMLSCGDYACQDRIERKGNPILTISTRLFKTC
jgi:hypothetical protein